MKANGLQRKNDREPVFQADQDHDEKYSPDDQRAHQHALESEVLGDTHEHAYGYVVEPSENGNSDMQYPLK